MICIECNQPIRKGEAFESWPGEKVIHESCADAILDKPVPAEKESTKGPKSREWMI